LSTVHCQRLTLFAVLPVGVRPSASSLQLVVIVAGSSHTKASAPSLVAEIKRHLEVAPDRFLRYASTRAEVFDDRRLTLKMKAEAGIGLISGSDPR